MTRIRPGLQGAGFFLILLLCLLAQQQLLDRLPVGYLYLGAAGVLALLLIAPRARAISPEASAAESLEGARGLRLGVGLILVVIGLGFIAYSASTFHTELITFTDPDEFPWVLDGIGLAFLLVGGLMIVGIGRPPRLDVTIWIAVAVLGLAVFVRVYQLDQYPFGVWYDEALYGLYARRWLAEPGFRPVFIDNITFPHLFGDVLGLQLFGSTNVTGLRVISAALGSAGVILAYLLGRMLRGVWFGIMMAFLLAALRWSIDFSRIGMIGAELVTFALLIFYTALRLIRYGRLRDALWFGVSLALGAFGYSTYQTQVIALAIYFLLSYPFLRRAKLRTLALGLTAVLATLVVLMPLLVYIVDHSDSYFNRLNEVSIFNEDLPPDKSRADVIALSTLKHLQMFHLSGDRNGRHNLPNAPMLDPVTGSLLVIGLFIALRERWREHLLFILSMLAALLTAILSVSFEAPQSLRSIGVICGVVYFAALGLEGMIRLAVAGLTALLSWRERAAYRLAGVGALAALGLMAAWNFNVYFNLQRASLLVWSAYSTTESLTGRAIANYPADTRFFLSPLIGISPPVRFLADSAVDRSAQMVMPDPFPLRIVPNTPAVIMLISSEKFYLDYLRQLYPKAQFHSIRPVDYGVYDAPTDVLFNVIDLSAQDVGAIQGLSDGRGVIYIPAYDNYIFVLAPNVQLEIDNQLVTSGTPIRLAEGNHAIAVTPPNAALKWQLAEMPADFVPAQYLYHDPVTPNGLLASFYNSPDWQGTPVVKRIYPFVYWQIQVLPMARPYSVRYDGYLYAATSGQYQMILKAIDHAELDLDGTQVIATTIPNNDVQVTVTLAQGWHPIEVRFQDLTSDSRVFLSWTPPGAGDRAPIARDYFCPALDLCATPPSP